MEKTYLQQVGERLYQTRTSNCLSRKELAQLAGVSVFTVRTMERGEKAVDIEEAQKICKELNCSIDYILTGNCGLAEMLKMNQKFLNLADCKTENLEKLAKFFWNTRPKAFR